MELFNERQRYKFFIEILAISERSCIFAPDINLHLITIRLYAEVLGALFGEPRFFEGCLARKSEAFFVHNQSFHLIISAIILYIVSLFLFFDGAGGWSGRGLAHVYAAVGLFETMFPHFVEGFERFVSYFQQNVF
ncbi:MAG: hypothetical protein MJZ98_07690 [Paludibacteraceae bacterium]|nr:hypothetical protein [Paludibacteraceae bacterium]